MISVHHRLNVNILKVKFLFIYETFFARVCFLMVYLTWQNFTREKWLYKAMKILQSFGFVLFWNSVFTYKISQPRIYGDLIRFQSRLKDSIYMPTLMKSSYIPFSIHSFHVLQLGYEWE